MGALERTDSERDTTAREKTVELIISYRFVIDMSEGGSVVLYVKSLGTLIIAAEIRTVHGLLIRRERMGHPDVVKAKRFGEDGNERRLSRVTRDI